MTEDRVREQLGFSHLLNVKEVRDLLGVSTYFLYELIRDGRLRTVNLKGNTVEASKVDDSLKALRFYPADVREFLKNSELT